MSNDKALKQTVLDELQWEPSVNAAHIGVTAKDGVVTLMGHVENYAEKAAAEKAARRVNDVKAVAEEIEVRLPFSVKHGDDDIASAAVNRLRWDSSVPEGAVKTKVEKGWVTLTGEVDWHYQQEAAVNDIRGLWGVIGVSNQITIKPSPNTSTIRENIIKALDRSWFDPAAIDVTAQGGNVKLTGRVNSWYEREEANAAAWAAPGTTSVENTISVA
ncbi:BON domain-containing protein [Ancylobacter lacus]|uniref:BON domain-containing protein n=1 Tax=Ancylobacter lacus TaxID=2579970 RepID=UPI001BD0A225|nr:BON domain-containing protein [Ancylobacter lacus]MBS7541181.1 BON domain-containing protein [Ancylobacter lacus]